MVRITGAGSYRIRVDFLATMAAKNIPGKTKLMNARLVTPIVKDNA
jgi:hypothetical protein